MKSYVDGDDVVGTSYLDQPSRESLRTKPRTGHQNTREIGMVMGDNPTPELDPESPLHPNRRGSYIDVRVDD